MQEIITDKKTAEQRLDKFLMKYLNKAPKSFVYKMLRKKNIKLNGKKAEGSEILAEGDVIALFLSDDTISNFREDINIKKPLNKPVIIYEDENIIIADKPAGLLVQGDKNEGCDNLNDMLLYYLQQNGELSDVFKPGVANRLDRNTGGLVLMGKNLPAAQALAKALRENRIEKLYITAVKGQIGSAGEISGSHTKDKHNLVTISEKKTDLSSEVKTLYTPLFSDGKYTVLRVKLITGKSHQIRACFGYIAHPLIGDPKYGDEAVNRLFRQKFGLTHQLLYAVSVKLTGEDGILEYLNGRIFECDPDKTSRNVLNAIKEGKL